MNEFNKLVPQFKYRPDIDGLRALAVLAVVFHHLSARLLPGGYVGVDVFFVISGYLITAIISREIAEDQFTFKRFYQRRIRRIFPALFTVLIFTMVAGYFILLPSDYAAMLRAVLGTLFFFSNMVFWHDLANGYFAATDTKLNPLLHTWSLGVEEQFYVVFPCLLLIVNFYFRKHVVWILVAGALVALVAAELQIGKHPASVFFLSPYRAWELLAGALLAYHALPELRNQFQREVVAVLGLLAILVPCFMYTPQTRFPGLSALAPVLGSVAIIYAGRGALTSVGRLLSWRPVVYIGLISYSLYLWHWSLIVLTQHQIEMGALTIYKPALLIVSLMLASLSYHFVEQPFRHNRVVTRKTVFSLALGFSILLAGVSVAGLLNNGFVTRFDPAVSRYDDARSPDIPFVDCDGRATGRWCQLGATNRAATVMVWGDSHALAWAPALDVSLNHQGLSAIFAPVSDCAPVFNADSSNNIVCRDKSLSIELYLSKHTEIKTVVLSAMWSRYFGVDGPLSVVDGDQLLKGEAAARQAFLSTLQWLKAHGKKVVLIGPVPVYDMNVPLALAFGSAHHHDFVFSNADVQYKKNELFFEIGNKFLSGAGVRLLDPISWMCNEQCVVESDGVALYRDVGHLSVAGAMQYQPDIEAAFAHFK